MRKAFQKWHLRSQSAKVMDRLKNTITTELVSKQAQKEQIILTIQAKQQDLKQEM